MSRSFLAAIRNAVTSAEDEPAPRSAPVAGDHGAVATRFAAILKAEGIAGNATRMDAAIDLATRSPDMAAEDVVAFVVANVAAVFATPSGAALSNRFAIDPATGARADPNAALPVAFQSGLPTTAADGWAEAIAQAAGKRATTP